MGNHYICSFLCPLLFEVKKMPKRENIHLENIYFKTEVHLRNLEPPKTESTVSLYSHRGRHSAGERDPLHKFLKGLGSQINVGTLISFPRRLKGFWTATVGSTLGGSRRARPRPDLHSTQVPGVPNSHGLRHRDSPAHP